ncbi:hypothetical protein KUTeg_001816 [Tegillarca granosa]|uniref:Sugar phosphate transporter domain-containing protein n=1 Tax=Tegillarca granosa TaxID=220873 RepID=A0ABQ9FSJ1_TEGGR|nr:hypothetical protein KUTeg_001816 [Tegillarca granosa]
MSDSLQMNHMDNAHIDMSLDMVKLKPGANKHIVKKMDDDEKMGLLNVRAFLFLILWYIFSAFTLFLNKYILATLKGDPALLGAMQMIMTATFGFIQMYLPLGFYKPVKREGKPPNFWRNMVLVGCMRFSTVVLGLVALKFVAVSFTETVKSSAPLFTVFISQVLIGEYTGFYTFLSLIPIMGGLALCSAYELSFNIQGFIAALATNLTEWYVLFYKIPAELQFYTSIASVVIQIPACFFLIDLPVAQKSLDMTMLLALISNGIFFHFQITFLSGVGTITVTIGVLLYTKAKEIDHNRLEIKQHYPTESGPKQV